MSAGYLHPAVEAEGLRVRVRFDLENRTHTAWRPDGDICAGTQVYDPETAAFLSEGEWTNLPARIEPGAAAAVELSIELPKEDGRYHIYASPHTGSDGWFHELDWPFLVVEARVAQGAAAIEGFEVTTRSRLRRKSLPARVRTLLVQPVHSLWRNRRLLAALVRREISARYRGSLGGAGWTILHPLLLMLTYFFVFGVVMETRFGNDPSRAGFVLYFLAGMLPWLPFSEAVGRAPSVILENRNFVKKLVFPVETLPANLAVTGLVTEVFALIIFFALLAVTRGAPPLTTLWLPALAIPQLLLTLGCCWMLAACGVFLRDLGQVIGLFLTLVFFLTPICYPESQVPVWARGVLEQSPVFLLVRGYREILLEGRAPGAGSLAVLWAGAYAFCVLGHAAFWRLRRTFADVL